MPPAMSVEHGVWVKVRTEDLEMTVREAPYLEGRLVALRQAAVEGLENQLVDRLRAWSSSVPVGRAHRRQNASTSRRWLTMATAQAPLVSWPAAWAASQMRWVQFGQA